MPRAQRMRPDVFSTVRDCRWVFLDPSKRRRWCPSPACASRGRVRAHRARIGTTEPTTESAT
ncbi:CGNR zinc finger domain-containing protein [Arthrobacter sp. ISL-5]|uniref:CGNR zinc finger domain-containing protein n=1 Tax=Arthrobacter sp. ISL-5 TaxID=2819111 RepID=UPI0035A81B97